MFSVDNFAVIYKLHAKMTGGTFPQYESHMFPHTADIVCSAAVPDNSSFTSMGAVNTTRISSLKSASDEGAGRKMHFINRSVVLQYSFSSLLLKAGAT